MATIVQDGRSKVRWYIIGVHRGILRLIFETSETNVLTVLTIVQDRPLKARRSITEVRRGTLGIRMRSEE